MKPSKVLLFVASPFLFIKRSLSTLREVGVEGNLYEERKAIVIVNTLSIVTGLAAFIIGFFLAALTSSVEIFLGALVEGSLFLSVLVMNGVRLYKLAAIVFAITQYGAAFYFGAIFGQDACIQLLSICLGVASLLIFDHRTAACKIFLSMSILLFFIVTLNNNIGFIEPIDNVKPYKTYITVLGTSVILLMTFTLIRVYIVNTQKTLTQERITRLALQEADKNKSSWLQTTIHDIRKPISLFKNLLTLAKFENSSATIEHITLNKESLDSLTASAAAADNIIGKQLEMTKIESGNLIRYSVFDLESVIIGILTLFKHDATEKGIIFHFPRERHLYTVHSDISFVTRVMTNLLHNAVKYAPSKSTIEVLLYRRSYLGYEAYTIKVINEGPEIPGPVIARMFHTGVRNKTEADSYGLGLPASRQLARKLGGDLECQCEDNKVIFKFFLLDKCPFDER